jgi:2-methylisocitrate lyase-like PEP mutase family enzyme
MTTERQTTRLRAMISKKGEMVVAASCYDPFTARLAEIAGFKAVHLSGFGHEVTQIGAPDLGIQTMTEIASQAARIADCIDIPMIADVDTGFGGVINIRRTIREMERAGVAGIHIEDQVQPKRCPVLGAAKVVDRATAVDRIKAAVDARRDADFVIVARSDSGDISLDELVERSNLYLEAGADMAMPMFPFAYFTLPPDEQMAMIEKVCTQINGKIMATGGPPPRGYTTADLKRVGYSFTMYAAETLQASANAVSELFQSILQTGNSFSYFDSHPGAYRDGAELMGAVHLQQYVSFERANDHTSSADM